LSTISSVSLCFTRGAIERLKTNSCDAIICPKEIEDLALKKVSRVFVFSGQSKGNLGHIVDVDYKHGLEYLGLGLVTNSTYKFILDGVLEVIELLEELNPSEVRCFGGGGAVPLSTVFGDNIESSYALLTCKSYVINEAVSQWCCSNGVILVWQRFSKIRLSLEFSLRCIALLTMSFGAIIIGRNQARCLQSGCGEKIAIYRSELQKDILSNLPFEDFYEPLNNSCQRGYQGVKRFFTSAFLCFKALTQILKNYLSKNSFISCRLKGFTFRFKALPTVIENICLLEHNYYSLVLSQRLKTGDVKEVYSCEMISRFASIDRDVCDKFSVLSVGVQAGLLSQRAVPIFPVHQRFIAMSSSECSALSNIYKSDGICYQGPLKRFDSSINTKYDILIITQPYAQDVIQQCITKIAHHHPDLRCKVRVHPRDSNRYDVTGSNVSLDSNGKCLDSILQSKIVLGMTSSALYDAADAGKATIIICMDAYTKHVMENGYDLHGKAICTSTDELMSTIRSYFLVSDVVI